MKVSIILHKIIIIFTSGLFLVISAFNHTASAQIFAPKHYPQHYFAWPLKATIGIAANFGELRPNHYHMGLDCRTDKKQNIPVLAAADGYIAKVKIEPYGFGRAIYINHPNGYSTLYAHLNDFYPALEKYVQEQQYKAQSWKIFLDIPPDLFPVNKEDFIAYSGNTGGSQGPHLHFEIRETQTDKVLNPLLFGMPLPDTVPPLVLRLAVYDRNSSSFEQVPSFYSLLKKGNYYTVTDSCIAFKSNKVSFAITAVDNLSGSNNPNGIYEADLLANDQPIVGFQLDDISYDDTRYLNAHIDYKLKNSGGPFVQHLSRLPGYPPGVYKEKGGNGIIDLDSTNGSSIQILVKDAAGNTSTIQFKIKAATIAAIPNPTNKSQYFQAGYLNVFENNQLRFYLPEKALYDDIHFNYVEPNTKTAFPIYSILNGNIPLQTYFPVSIFAPALKSNKVVMHRYWNGKHDYSKAPQDRGWFTASFREFGNFQLLIDSTAPTISPVGFKEGMSCSKSKSLSFIVADNTEELSFSAWLDGAWICFSNDKGRKFIYAFDEHCLPGKHELKIMASDQVGNTSEKIYHFTR